MAFRNPTYFTENNQLSLLHSGADFFPALVNAIDSARSEIYLETYIFSEDVTGKLVHDALCRAAQRGVKVHVIADWLGTGKQRTQSLAASFAVEGVQFRCFNPWFVRGLSRTHRKLFVADQKIAIVGGININHDLFSEGENRHVLSYPRWDFAVAVTGPLVTAVHQLMSEQWGKLGSLRLTSRLKMLLPNYREKYAPTVAQPILAALAPRDNLLYRRTIQRAYLQAITNAHERILIATPYFAPGRKFRNALIRAAQRGVHVTLLIGCGDYRIQDAVAHSYYPKLLKHGVEIFEYRKSQLHAKVAAIDGQWCTVGSCNCDALSLLINQEANILINDANFTAKLAEAIVLGIADGEQILLSDYKHLSQTRKFWYGCAFLLYSALVRIIAVEDFM